MIDTTIQKLCDTGAQAVQRYVVVSGLDPWYMPEYFMPAFMLDHLGDEVTMTLETKFSLLWAWNDGDRSRPLPDGIGSPRVDLVIYKDPHLAKSMQSFLALVELKRGWVDGDPDAPGDRHKLMGMLEYIDTCNYGVVCGWAKAVTRDWARKNAEKAGDRWFESKFELDGVPYFFCASVFARTDPVRLAA